MTGPTTQAIEVGGRTISPGEKRQFRYSVGTSFHGDSIDIPVTVVNGDEDGSTVFLSAAVHGDELNGIKIVEDLNRSFPGNPQGTMAKRLAHTIFEEFVSKCDLGLDFHTSTRNRTTMYHVRADMRDPDVERIARAFGTSVILDGEGSDGTLRKAASKTGVPTVTVEMGRAHRFQSTHLGRALHCVASILAEHEVLPDRPVSWPGWTRVIARDGEKTWLRADTGGLVEMKWGPQPLVEDGETLFTISDHFKDEVEVVRAPSTGLIVGVLENAVAYPGHPLCHFVSVEETTADIIRDDIERGVFDVYREGGFQWPESGENGEHDGRGPLS